MSILFRFNIKKFLSGALGAVFFIANCALAHATETNFWASRRSASQRIRANESSDFSKGSSNEHFLLAQLPKAGPLELGGGRSAPFSQKASEAGKVPFAVGPTTGDWLGKLVMPFGNVNDVYLSPKKDAPFIVHIQDAHGIEEAQRNISSMIGLLGQEPGINLVGVEGAWGSFSLEPYRDFPDPAMTKDVAEFLLKKGLIAGPEYAGLTMSKSPAFFGVENSDLYHANVKALKSAFKDKEAAVAWVDALQSHTEKLKVSDYSETLKTFDRHFSGYQSEKVKLADYVRYLTTTLTQIKPRPATPQLQLLMEALIQEGDLDFKRVEAERKQMVEKLVDKLSKDQIQDIVNKSVDYRAGRVGYAEYHAHLKQTCQDHGISMKAYPQMGRYIAYVLTADKIDRRALLNELDTVERTLPESLAKTPKEKELVALTYDLSLLNKLVRHEMSPADWTHYLARGKYIHTVPERVASLGGAPSPAFALTAFEDFCRFAAERNTALTGNLTQQMVNTKTNYSILIAGGFHTEGLSALLRQRQISYVVVTPKITAIPKDNPYLDVLARDPAPLEQLLTGDRIYLAKPLAMADPHSSAALLISAIGDLLRNNKSIVPIDDTSSLTTDPGPQRKMLLNVLGRPIYFTSSLSATRSLLKKLLQGLVSFLSSLNQWIIKLGENEFESINKNSEKTIIQPSLGNQNLDDLFRSGGILLKKNGGWTLINDQELINHIRQFAGSMHILMRGVAVREAREAMEGRDGRILGRFARSYAIEGKPLVGYHINKLTDGHHPTSDDQIEMASEMSMFANSGEALARMGGTNAAAALLLAPGAEGRILVYGVPNNDELIPHPESSAQVSSHVMGVPQNAKLLAILPSDEQDLFRVLNSLSETPTSDASKKREGVDVWDSFLEGLTDQNPYQDLDENSSENHLWKEKIIPKLFGSEENNHLPKVGREIVGLLANSELLGSLVNRSRELNVEFALFQDHKSGAIYVARGANGSLVKPRGDALTPKDDLLIFHTHPDGQANLSDLTEGVGSYAAYGDWDFLNNQNGRRKEAGRAIQVITLIWGTLPDDSKGVAVIRIPSEREIFQNPDEGEYSRHPHFHVGELIVASVEINGLSGTTTGKGTLVIPLYNQFILAFGYWFMGTFFSNSPSWKKAWEKAGRDVGSVEFSIFGAPITEIPGLPGAAWAMGGSWASIGVSSFIFSLLHHLRPPPNAVKEFKTAKGFEKLPVSISIVATTLWRTIVQFFKPDAWRIFSAVEGKNQFNLGVSWQLIIRSLVSSAINLASLYFGGDSTPLIFAIGMVLHSGYNIVNKIFPEAGLPALTVKTIQVANVEKIQQEAKEDFLYFLNKLSDLTRKDIDQEASFYSADFENWSYEHPPSVPPGLANLIVLIHGELFRSFPAYQGLVHRENPGLLTGKAQNILVFWNSNRQLLLAPPTDPQSDRGANALHLIGTNIRSKNTPRLRIENLIGIGTYGAAYRAIAENGDFYLIKTTAHPDRLSTLAMALVDIGFLLHEGNILKRISEKKVSTTGAGVLVAPRFFGFALTEKTSIAFISEYVEGKTLWEEVKNTAAPTDLSFEVAIDFVRQLAALHEAGFVHRDIKANNIILDKNGKARLVDFGAALQFKGPKDREIPEENMMSDLAYLNQTGTPMHFSIPLTKPGFDYFQLWSLFDLSLPFFRNLSPLLKENPTNPLDQRKRTEMLAADPFLKKTAALWEALQVRFFRDIILNNSSPSDKKEATIRWLRAAQREIEALQLEEISRLIPRDSPSSTQLTLNETYKAGRGLTKRLFGRAWSDRAIENWFAMFYEAFRILSPSRFSSDHSFENKIEKVLRDIGIGAMVVAGLAVFYFGFGTGLEWLLSDSRFSFAPAFVLAAAGSFLLGFTATIPVHGLLNSIANTINTRFGKSGIRFRIPRLTMTDSIQVKQSDREAWLQILLEAFQNGRLGVFEKFLPIPRTVIEGELNRIAQSIAKEQLLLASKVIPFREIPGTYGGTMVAFEHPMLPNIVIKAARVTHLSGGGNINFEKDVLPGYLLAKERLGGIFALMVLDMHDKENPLRVEGTPINTDYIIVQERVKPLDDILVSIRDSTEREHARRRFLSQIKDVVFKKMNQRGLVETDSDPIDNLLRNYGINSHNDIVGFDVDGIKTIPEYKEDVISRGGNPTELKEIEIMEKVWKGTGNGEVRHWRVHDMFLDQVRPAQISYLTQVLAQDNRFIDEVIIFSEPDFDVELGELAISWWNKWTVGILYWVMGGKSKLWETARQQAKEKVASPGFKWKWAPLTELPFLPGAAVWGGVSSTLGVVGLSAIFSLLHNLSPPANAAERFVRASGFWGKSGVAFAISIETIGLTLRQFAHWDAWKISFPKGEEKPRISFGVGWQFLIRTFVAFWINTWALQFGVFVGDSTFATFVAAYVMHGVYNFLAPYLSLPALNAQPNRVPLEKESANNRENAVLSIFQKSFSDRFYMNRYIFSKHLAYENMWGGSEGTVILLPKFIDEIFRRALTLGDVQSTKIVFLKAGAQPLFAASEMTARVSGVFPVDNIKTIWATMKNHRSMKADPNQAELFIKYLHDEGVLTPETKHLLIVDTDTGLGGPGTELIFAESLLNNGVLEKANSRFGIKISPFNEPGSENSLDFFYLMTPYDRNPALFDSYMASEQVPPAIKAKLRISGYRTMGLSDSEFDEIAALWSPIDRFDKIENIGGEFILTEGGRVIVNPLPPDNQFSNKMVELNLGRTSQETGLLMGVLDVLEDRGFDVTDEAKRLITGLEKAIDAEKSANNIFYYVLRLFMVDNKANKKWSMRLLPLEISGLGWAGWFASRWAHTVLSGAVAFDPTLMGVLLMAGGILAFRGLHLGLDRLWYAKNPGQGPPSKDFWSNTARMMPYAMLPILTSSPVVFLVAFSVLAYDHFAFDLKRLFNINAPLANATKILVISMVSATFAVAIGPIIVSNLASPMGTFFLVSLAAQALDPGTLQSFSENPASGLIALGIGSVSNFLTYAFAMEWASMVLLGSVTSKLIYNTRQSPIFSFALAGGDSQRMASSNSTIQTQADRPLNTISDNRGDYESYLISSPHSLLTKGRLERNLQIARQTAGVKSVFYLGAGTDLTHVLTSFPDATHVTLSGNNYGNITAESIKNEMTTTQTPSERTQQFLNTYKDSVLNDYKESVLNHGFAGTSLVQKSSMQSSFLALELLSLGVQTNSLREEHAGEISFEVPGLLGRPPRRVSFILKNNSFSRSPIQMNDGKREFDGFFAKAIDGIQPYYKEIFSALAERFSSSLTVVSDNAIPDNVGDIGFIKTSAFSLSDEDSGSYGNAFQVVKLSRSTLTGQDNNSAALAVISLIETRGLGKIADNLRPFVSAREYRQPFEFSEETTASDIGTAISILEEEDASIKAAEEYGRQWALAEGPNTRMVAVLFKIDSWAQETREIALAVVRGMLSAGKVIVVADERFDTTTIKTENQDKLEIIQVNEITDKFMERVKEIHSGPISKKVLVSEQHSRFLNDEYVAFIIEGLLRAIQNKIDALLAVLRAA